jgi:hypothetical protein
MIRLIGPQERILQPQMNTNKHKYQAFEELAYARYR